jgi:hypothetical protein
MGDDRVERPPTADRRRSAFQSTGNTGGANRERQLSTQPRRCFPRAAKVGYGACVTDAPSEYAGAELYER